MRGTAPSVGDTAPDFTLKVLNSDQTVTLSERMGNGRPVVLVFGSYT
jgi:peroxiredoxin